jgi:nicotinamidase/pyrazinamidase
MSLAILLVDPQVDFFPGGALPVARGDEIVAPVNRLLERYPQLPLFASRDWHPGGSRHFKERGGTWVPHCVQGTPGAEFHEALRMGRAHVYSKGTNPEDDAGYSAFEGARIAADGTQHALGRDLRDDGITDLLVAGLATDYCVRASVLDALKEGFRVWLYLPGVRPVDVKPGDGDRAIEEMAQAGAFLVER